MHEIEAFNIDTGYLGDLNIVGGDKREYRVRFEQLLGHGVILTGVTATVTSSISTISVPVMWDDYQSFTFFITSNNAFEVFTAAFNVTDSTGQTTNWTLIFHVEAPVTETITPNPQALIIGPTGATGPGPVGFSGTITTASLGTSQGSMTFTNGLLTSQVRAT